MQLNILAVDLIEFAITLSDVGLVAVARVMLHSSESLLSVPGTVQLNFAVRCQN